MLILQFRGMGNNSHFEIAHVTADGKMQISLVILSKVLNGKAGITAVMSLRMPIW